LATCTQIEHALHTYIDGELSAAEKVIVELHVHECPSCAASLRSQQRAVAILFEGFAPVRLGRSLRQPVMENLPEMETLAQELEQVNWRAKHPIAVWNRIGRFMPVAAVLVMFVALLILNENWPQSGAGHEALGVVMQCEGAAMRLANETDPGELAAVASFVSPGDLFETGPDSTLMMSLMGPTEVKLNANTAVRVDNDRRLTVLRGDLWLNVGQDGRLFRVVTPSGNVTVYGTRFTVRVDTAHTLVTVEEGSVKVDNETPVFQVLAKGQQVNVQPGVPVEAPHELAGEVRTAWAERITPQDHAANLFEQVIVPRSKMTELPAKQVYWVNATLGGRQWSINTVRLAWKPEPRGGERCGYTMYVYDEKWRPLLKEYLPASLFAGQARSSYEVSLGREPVTGVQDLVIELVPDYGPGEIETAFRVSARGM